MGGGAKYRLYKFLYFHVLLPKSTIIYTPHSTRYIMHCIHVFLIDFCTRDVRLALGVGRATSVFTWRWMECGLAT